MDTTKDDLLSDCIASIKAIAEDIGFQEYKADWLNKLNKTQLDQLSLFLDSAWREMQ